MCVAWPPCLFHCLCLHIAERDTKKRERKCTVCVAEGLVLLFKGRIATSCPKLRSPPDAFCCSRRPPQQKYQGKNLIPLCCRLCGMQPLKCFHQQTEVLLLLKFLKHKELKAIVAALLTFYCHNWQSDELTSCCSQTKICPPLPIKQKHFYTLVFVQIKKTRCNILCYAKVDTHWLPALQCCVFHSYTVPEGLPGLLYVCTIGWYFTALLQW